jgi:hypothetical protein
MVNLIRRSCLILLAGVMLSASANDSVPVPDMKQERLCLRGPTAAAISLRGAYNYDKAGGKGGAMMYPAPGLAGFLVAIATHGALSAGLRESEKSQVRADADVVTVPYQAALAAYKHEELMQTSLMTMKTAGEKRVTSLEAAPASGELVIDTAPAFYLTQDQRAIILENAIRINRAKGAPYEKIIRVVSSVQDEKAGAALWLANEGFRLKEESARMYAQSLDIAVDDMKLTGESSAPFKTVRYFEGGTEKMERAQVISEQCSHMVLRTLRGDMLAVPRKAAEASCGS